LEASLGKVSKTLFQKNKIQNERAGCVAQVVDHLYIKEETLSLIPSTMHTQQRIPVSSNDCSGVLVM
jgi:hypothetical protein